MRINSIIYLILVVLAVPICLAQQAAIHPAYNDTMAMKVSITYDKESYLTGEEVIVTLTVANPLNRVAHVIEPFTFNAGMVTISTKHDSGSWASLYDHSSGTCWTCENMPTVTLQPLEVRRFVFRTGDPACSSQPGPFIQSCRPPSRPGTHGFSYLYGSGAGAKFAFEATTIREAREVAHSTPSRVAVTNVAGEPTGKYREYPRADAAFILEANGKRYVAITSFPHVSFGSFALGTVLRNLEGDRVGPFRLIDESTEEITDLKFSSDEKENFRVTYNRGREVGRTLRFDSSRKLIPEKE